jgi:glutathione reductase (NADPH)
VVGLTEEAAAVKHPRVAVYYSRFAPLMHKMSGQGHKGFLCKVVTDHSTGRVLGVHVCGADAAEIIQVCLIYTPLLFSIL